LESTMAEGIDRQLVALLDWDARSEQVSQDIEQLLSSRGRQ